MKYGIFFRAAIVSALCFGLASCSSSGDDDNGGKDGGSDGSQGTGGGGGGTGQGGSSGGIIIDAGKSDGLDRDSACAGEKIVGEASVSNLLFLIDKSGSMKCNPPPDMSSADCEKQPKKVLDKPSKWEITVDGLKGAVDKLATMDPVPRAGISFFNAGSACSFADVPDVDILELDSSHLTLFKQAIDDRKPWGATPIVGALMRAYDYFYKKEQAEDPKDRMEGNRFVVLLTDGKESCDENYIPTLIQKADEARRVGIKTFVLGAPGSELSREVLSQLAYNGGTAKAPDCSHKGAGSGYCHMDMTQEGMVFAEELAKNMEEITGRVIGCEFRVPKTGADGRAVNLNEVNVLYTPGSGGETQQIKKSPDQSCDDPANMGWQYNKDRTLINICKGMCDKLQADNGAQVEILLGCATDVVR